MSALCYGRGGLALTEDRKREFLATTAKAFVESANAFMEAHGGGWIAGADITVADFVYWHVRLNGGPEAPRESAAGARLTATRDHGRQELEKLSLFAEGALDGAPRLRAMIAALEAQPAVKTYMASDGFIHWPIYGASRPVLQRTEPLEPQVSFLTSRRQPSVPGASAHWGGGGGDPKTER